jgi:hypothetical protein
MKLRKGESMDNFIERLLPNLPAIPGPISKEIARDLLSGRRPSGDPSLADPSGRPLGREPATERTLGRNLARREALLEEGRDDLRARSTRPL